MAYAKKKIVDTETIPLSNVNEFVKIGLSLCCPVDTKTYLYRSLRPMALSFPSRRVPVSRVARAEETVLGARLPPEPGPAMPRDSDLGAAFVQAEFESRDCRIPVDLQRALDPSFYPRQHSLKLQSTTGFITTPSPSTRSSPRPGSSHIHARRPRCIWFRKVLWNTRAVTVVQCVFDGQTAHALGCRLAAASR